MPVLMVGLLILVVMAPAFIFFSEKGPGAVHAFWAVSLIAGIVVGGLAQYTRLCMVGGIRDIILFHETKLLMGFVAVFVAAFLVNLAFGNFHPGFANQPIAHTDGLSELPRHGFGRFLQYFCLAVAHASAYYDG